MLVCATTISSWISIWNPSLKQVFTWALYSFAWLQIVNSWNSLVYCSTNLLPCLGENILAAKVGIISWEKVFFHFQLHLITCACYKITSFFKCFVRWFFNVITPTPFPSSTSSFLWFLCNNFIISSSLVVKLHYGLVLWLLKLLLNALKWHLDY